MDQLTTPLVSVIIPIYQAEKTLCKALDSVLGQTLTEFEVILIDDGSTDNSGYICDEYVRKDRRVKVVHQCNKGVSAARQCGIERARGEYSIHVDPDDWVEPEMLQELYRCAKRHDADMVICDFYENSYKGQKYIKQEPSALDASVVLEDIFFKLHGSTCNKLIKHSCYIRNKVHFPLNISFCEDQYVIASLLLNNLKVAYLPKAFYHYQRDDSKKSLSLKYTEASLSEDILIRSLFNQLLKDTNIRQQVYSMKSYMIVSKAFFGGRHLFSSKMFKEIFIAYVSYVKESKSNWIEKLLIYISCRGGYQFCVRLFDFLLQINHNLVRK
ncbi:glycosyltransferase, group 2 family protein [Prevotella sp. BV3P1]|uniref:glycosyltransferase family 2 protein n=1 Tax=Prevotellaceae TaxID=171552 RepID=UPI0003B8B291|nr:MULTISPECIES: glycosyltransferase family 2 protein [Prevotellaceae]ERT59913.1 glycosyltransferase, group 2 family protein [Prevotella sp. BV3P1]KGF40680.1 hypothetical protein HMPREF2140_06650 [Hoylesella buccalis DNF00985]